MTFVLDASVSLAWCFEDEANPFCDGILRRLEVNPAIVPSLWQLEVVNALVTAERRQRISPQQSARFLDLLTSLPIDLETTPPDATLLLSLARTYALSAYDAAYLAVALKRSLPLATQDIPLREAAIKASVELLT